MPPNPNTAATSATIRNINDQYSMACSSCGVRDWRSDNAGPFDRFRTIVASRQLALGENAHDPRRNRYPRSAFIPLESPLPKPTEAPMQRELTPVESRGGVVSGRVLLVLVLSFVGALIALGLSWAFLFPR